NVSSAPGATTRPFWRGGGTGIFNGIASLEVGFFKTDSGTWQINSTGHSWPITQVADGLLRMGADNVLPTVPLLMGQGSATVGRFDLNGFDQLVAGLDVDNASSSKASLLITNSGAAATLTTDADTDFTYEGQI